MKRNFLMAVGVLGLASLGGCYAEVSPYACQPATPVYYLDCRIYRMSSRRET